MSKTRTMSTGAVKAFFAVLATCALALAFVAVSQPTQAHATYTEYMHRLYNPNSGEHFYTSSEVEFNDLVGRGWNDEGKGWTAITKGDPVYRLYNPNAGEHHYTTDNGERAGLVEQGWNYEGIGWYSDPAVNVPLYRLYNPNEYANNHHYTTDWNEAAYLMDIGWEYEGESWYGVNPGDHFVEIDMKDYGTITVSLNASAAPKTVENFIGLVNKNFYDGLGFHRIIKDFMMQGGDPQGTGTGGSGTNIIGEFKDNGHDNPISHTRGAVSMARSTAPNSASSQFFICHKDVTDLDGHYATFGHVIEGIEIVDKICDNAKPTDNNGSIAKDQRPIINTIRLGTF